MILDGIWVLIAGLFYFQGTENVKRIVESAGDEQISQIPDKQLVARAGAISLVPIWDIKVVNCALVLASPGLVGGWLSGKSYSGLVVVSFGMFLAAILVAGPSVLCEEPRGEDVCGSHRMVTTSPRPGWSAGCR